MSDETERDARWDVTFPLGSLREAAPHLRRPFAPAAVKFKLQSTWEKGGLVVAHIDARLVIERLNLVVPHLWNEVTVPVGAGLLLCKLTIDGVSHEDIGEGAGKALYSDALKRAAVRFGIGVSIYALAQARLDVGQAPSELRTHGKKKRGDKEYWAHIIDPRTDAWLREGYAKWLEARGEKAFGPALDHGDEPDAQALEEDVTPETTAEPALPLLDDDRSNELRDEIRAAYDVVKRADSKRLLPGDFNRRLAAAGVSHEALEALRDELLGMSEAVAA